MTDPRTAYGLQVEARVTGPYSTLPAKRDGTGNDGGTIDRAIIAHTEDGREVMIGEVWAAGHGRGGMKIRIDAAAVAQGIVDTLNERSS
ncbi:hypothetical protein LCGC14_2498950 [marine sediment metagenome]|uniref:Uncharacterized protein n=1 Tax=marine sediment metagenome TaxID=412755 RepID=A0A0F9B2D0_9ZZZZ